MINPKKLGKVELMLGKTIMKYDYNFDLNEALVDKIMSDLVVVFNKKYKNNSVAINSINLTAIRIDLHYYLTRRIFSPTLYYIDYNITKSRKRQIVVVHRPQLLPEIPDLDGLSDSDMETASFSSSATNAINRFYEKDK